MRSEKFPFIIRLICFWMCYFLSFRILFIIYNSSKIQDGNIGDTLLSFVYALRLDFATACILSIFPFFLWAIQQFTKLKLIHNINKFFNLSIITIITLLSVSNIKLYNEWGIQLTARALQYIFYPEEILAFIGTQELIGLFILLFILLFSAIKIYLNISDNFSAPALNNKLKTTLLIVAPTLLVIGARGGVQLAPINESSSYYSDIAFNNHAATNNIWFLMHSVEDAMKTKNIYVFMDDTEAKQMRDSLFISSENNTKHILKTNKPNIVLIILESWTADIIEKLDGEKNVTPHFHKLSDQGILFTHMYSSGFRTEQGLVSIFSGFPAQPNHSIITTPSKSEQLPCINFQLKKAGYHSSFYYGGEIEFANMKSYLIHAGVSKIIDKENFSSDQQNSKWGAHDEFVFNKQLQDLNNEQQPFFSTVLTLSTHEPFEVPIQTPFNKTNSEEKFKKAAYYTDQCLNNYFHEAKKQKWYNNTLFILVADHGHHYPLNRGYDDPESHRITAMLYGDVIADSLKGTTIDAVCNQNDLPAVILSQLNMNHADFHWSKNILNSSTQAFAYYATENVLGWISPIQNIVYSYTEKKVENIQPKSDSILDIHILKTAQAYLQSLNKQYIDY
jgi:phosphoglycerol transferase MdoB-like AlkP superfamily enzyme